MAELNFNALSRPGPRGFYQGFEQGQEARNQLAQQQIKQQSEMQQQQMNALKMQGYTEDRASKMRAEKAALFRDSILRAPDPNTAREAIKRQYSDPDLGPFLQKTIPLEAALSEISDDPAQFKQYQEREALGIEGYAKSQLPKVAGNAVYDPRTNSFITAPREPAPVAQPAMVSEFNFARSPEGGGFQGSYQDFVIAREAAKRPPPAPRADRAPRTQQTTLSDGSIGLVNMDTGAVTPVTMGGVQVKGKPSAFAEKAAAQRVQLGKDLDFAIKELGEITKDGGLIDQSTGSGAGRLVDLGARFVGQATPGDIAIGKIAPVADLTLKMVPRFEGPQSDKDTKSYKEAAGQLADPTLPTAIRKEAGKTVLRLMIQRKGQFRTSDMAEDNANPVLDVRSQADAILNGGK
jgi:hypothetical protein